MFNGLKRWRKSWPRKLHRPHIRLLAWLELLVVDHGFLRAIYNTPEEVVSGIWRSNQPSPWRLKKLANRGFKTVISLRGQGTDGPWLLEKEACERYGLTLHSIRMKSNRAPRAPRLLRLHHILETCDKPVLIHCKSGADRSGLAAAVCLLRESPDNMERAKDHLSIRYLHSRTARTGVLDAFLREYEAFYARQPVPFMEWVEQHYQRIALIKSFRPKGFSSWVVDKVLRRE
ncbi:MAG: tyrosine-protein phosphatase [Natronospirillum sp.]|uniref:fused DSP-PTPase phosphatase/NAD kinase-like protein n=1 Tax=Natronospirillum sp. TaxID=2812955 RepID=UPI0025E274A6|nr:tyrosine-protein phosphatase [Natronospirillum sp.]MCH8553484.1 tyrosine-protein phosphatase [Natronospirillum sp.]